LYPRIGDPFVLAGGFQSIKMLLKVRDVVGASGASGLVAARMEN